MDRLTHAIIPAKAGERSTIRVEGPSIHAGLTAALRSSYEPLPLPDLFVRLLRQLH